MATVAIRKKKADAAKFLIECWLTEHAEYKVEDNITLGLTIPVDTDDKILGRLVDEYGGFSKTGEIRSWPDQIVSANIIEWRIACAYFSDISRLSRELNLDRFDCRLVTSIDFILLGKDQSPLPHQDLKDKTKLKSNLFIFYSSSSSLAPDINFPFSEDNEQFRQYFNNEFIESLPFKINEKYLRYHTIVNDKLKIGKIA